MYIPKKVQSHSLLIMAGSCQTHRCPLGRAASAEGNTTIANSIYTETFGESNTARNH